MPWIGINGVMQAHHSSEACATEHTRKGSGSARLQALPRLQHSMRILRAGRLNGCRPGCDLVSDRALQACKGTAKLACGAPNGSGVRHFGLPARPAGHGRCTLLPSSTWNSVQLRRARCIYR